MTDLVSAQQLPALALASRSASAPNAEVVAEVNNLIQAYALFTDHGCTAEVAQLFTPDATWDGTELGYGEAAGPVAIAAAVVSHFDPDRPMAHLPGPAMVVETSATEVEAYSWCLASRFTDGQSSPLIWFAYEDRLRLTSGRWLFSHRQLRLRFRGAA
jgi:hypothetical protein